MRQMLRGVRLIVFDLDGTLVDAYSAILDSINHMMARMGLPQQSLPVVKRSVGWGVDSLVRCFVEEGRVEEALNIFRVHHGRRLRQGIKFQPGAKALLPFLRRRGYRLAVASNRPTRFCRIILKTLGMEEYFFKVVGADAVEKPKPYPDMLDLILKTAKALPSEAVYVGDMSVDICCGRQAGVVTVAVPTGSCTLDEIKAERPDLLLRDLVEFRQFFPCLKAEKV